MFFQKKNFFQLSFATNEQPYQACNFIKKEALTQVFSCEFWETSKNNLFDRTPPVAASADC